VPVVADGHREVEGEMITVHAVNGIVALIH
jgi:hypothetical protein